MGLFSAIIGLKHQHLKCEKHIYRRRAFESVWSELLKKDQSGHPNLWKAPNCDVHQIWPSRNMASNYIPKKKQWLRLSFRTIEYATNTYEKYFYKFRINQITFIYGEREKERPNFYGMFRQNLRNSAALVAILKMKLPQCNVIGLRTPPALNAWLHCFLNMRNFSLRCYLIAREYELIFECIWLFVDLIRPHYSVKGKKKYSDNVIFIFHCSQNLETRLQTQSNENWMLEARFRLIGIASVTKTLKLVQYMR